MKKEIDKFLEWLNGSEENIIKAGIAHLWFVIIHPFDDGNGRIARSIGNYALSKEALKNIQFILQKRAFWDRHRTTSLNEREIKVLNRLFRVGEGNFEGGINTKKYASLTKVSKNTASRELKGLVEKGCLRQVEGTAGRNIRYELSILFGCLGFFIQHIQQKQAILLITN